MIKQALHTYLSEHRLIKDQIKASDGETRIYAGVARSSSVKPYITYQLISSVQSHHMDNASALNNSLFQFDVWGDDALKVESAAQALRLSLDGFRGDMEDVFVQAVFLSAEADDFFPATDSSQVGDFRQRLDFDIWYKRTVPDSAAQPLKI